MARYYVRGLLWIAFTALFLFTQKWHGTSDEAVLIMGFVMTWLWELMVMSAVEEYEEKKKVQQTKTPL